MEQAPREIILAEEYFLATDSAWSVCCFCWNIFGSTISSLGPQDCLRIHLVSGLIYTQKIVIFSMD